jgi:ATP phosphoribosyltransferase
MSCRSLRRARTPERRRADVWAAVLRLVLPKGSLEAPTLQLFSDADLTVKRSSDVDYRANIDDPRVDEVRILRPQEIPQYVADGMFDLGITGRDWVEETGSDVVTIGELAYSKNSSSPVRVVLCVAQDSPVQRMTDLPQGSRVSTEYPELTRRALEKAGVRADVRISYGATEAKVPEIADAVVEITETGRALRAAGLRIVETLLVSRTELVANPEAAADPTRRHAMDQLYTLLMGALEARTKVLLKMNVPAHSLEAVVEMLPAMKSPTVSELSGSGGFAIETVVEKSQVNILIPALKDRGASDIIELALSKIVH